MCQLPETRRPGWRNHKSNMKENSTRTTTGIPKTAHKVAKPRSHQAKHSTDNVLKRQRPVENKPTDSRSHTLHQHKDDGSSGPARYTAYQSQRSGASPLSQLLQSCVEKKTTDEVEKRLSPSPSSRQVDDCYSPPAKVQMSSPSQQPTYAGAKFHDPPSPNALPKPPTHWFNCKNTGNVPKSSCAEMTNVLKVMLNVQC